MDWKVISIEDAICDSDRYEDLGYCIFKDDAPQETIDGNLDHVIGKVEAEYEGLITIHEQYIDLNTGEHKFSADPIWSNE